MTNGSSATLHASASPLASGATYREILANSGEAIAIIDPTGRYLEQNAAHRELIGYADEELVGRTPAIHLGSRTMHEIAAELRRSGRYRGEVVTRTKDGRRLDVEINAFAVAGSGGEHLCYVGIKRNITERKRTERELRQQYEQLQALYRLTDAVGRAGRVEEIYEEALSGLQAAIGATRSSILLFDPDGVMRFKACRGISDRYRARVEGHSPWRPDTPDPEPITIADVRQDESLGPLREVILEEGIRALGFFPLTTQGRLLGKFMIYHDAPHRFEPAEIQLTQAIASQVALAIARKRDEDERRFQQALLAAQMEASIDGILVVSPEGKMISFNQRFVELWKLPAEVVRSRSDEAAQRVVCEQLEDPGEFLERIAYLYAHPDEISLDTIGLRDGRVIDRYSAPIASSGWSNRGRIWYFRDVTDSRRAEEVQRLLAEAGRILASSLEAESTLASLARLAVPYLGDVCMVHLRGEDGALRRVALAHADPTRERAVAEALGEVSKVPSPANPLAECIGSESTLFLPSLTPATLAALAGNARRARAAAKLGLGSALVVPLRARGRTQGTLSFIAPPSRRAYSPEDKALAEELALRAGLAVDNARLYASAVEANQAKADFLAVMSHELRTPLNGILGYADLLLLGVPAPLAEAARAHVERIGVSARHLLQIIEEILTFSRLEAGKEVVHPARIDLAALARDTAALVEPLAVGKGLRFDLDVEKGPVWIHTDPGRVRQILLNLLSNAIKFTERGRVCLGVSRRDDGAILRVCDTGIGMEPAQAERMFEPFWQADHSPTRRAGGAGLGLSVTRRLTELLGGVIRVKTTPGVGTEFTITLPREAAALPAEAAQPHAAP